MIIKYLRTKYCLSQFEVANYLNISRRTYVDLENNVTKEKEQKYFIKLAILYEVSMDYICGFTNKDKSLPKERLDILCITYNIDTNILHKLHSKMAQNLGKR